MNNEKIHHILTRKEARELHFPHLAGEEVVVILLHDHELEPSLRGRGFRIAKDVFYYGHRIGGTLSLED